MARKSTSTVTEEDFEPVAESRSYDDSPLDARMLDLDEEGESPFLRGQKRVPVRRGALPRKTADRIKLLLVVLLVLGVVGFVAVNLYRYATQSWRFRLDSSDNIEIVGMRNVSRSQVIEALGSDIDRNVFSVPLAEQKKQLETIPWVESATVMRFLPNRMRVEVRERIPVAFVDLNGRIGLIDAHGVLLDMPPGAQSSFSFPVVVGMSDSEPLSTRAAQMKIYNELVRQLDSTGANYSRDLSEINVSDPDDIKVTVSDPKGTVAVHLGSSGFLESFQYYVAHVQEWRAQFQRVDSVDLRYHGQVIMNPDDPRVRAKDVPVANDAPQANPAPAAAPSKTASTTKKTRKH